MFDPAAYLTKSTTNPREAAYRKLHWCAVTMKTLLVGYVLFGFFRFVPWWLNRSDLDYWQRVLGLGLNLVSWLLLVAAVVHIWRFFDCFQDNKTFTGEGGRYLMACAWFGIASQAATVIMRPMNHFIVTADFSNVPHRIEWNFSHRDPLAIVFCLALLMFAYVHRWMLEIAQENAEFV